jgi:hypothetical protein
LIILSEISPAYSPTLRTLSTIEQNQAGCHLCMRKGGSLQLYPILPGVYSRLKKYSLDKPRSPFIPFRRALLA